MVQYFGTANYSSSFLNFLQAWGFLDIILPFLLFFAILYAVLAKTNVVTDKRNIQVVIALVLSLLIVIPHMMAAVGRPILPENLDVVYLMYKILPEIAIVLLGVLLLMIILGLFFSKVEFANTGLGSIMTFIAIILVIGIFVLNIVKINGQSLLTKFPFWQRLLTPQNQAILVILIIFAVIVGWVTSEPSDKNKLEEGWKSFKNFFGEVGKGK